MTTAVFIYKMNEYFKERKWFFLFLLKAVIFVFLSNVQIVLWLTQGYPTAEYNFWTVITSDIMKKSCLLQLEY